MSSVRELVETVGRRVGRDGDGRKHRAPWQLDLPDETYHLIYDEEVEGVRFARLSLEGDGTYREEWSVGVPRMLSRLISFEAKAGGRR